MPPMHRGRGLTHPPPSQDLAFASAAPIELNTCSKGPSDMTNRVFHLLERHQKLDEQLHFARRRRWVDPIEIARIKKLKLMLKDRLARLGRKAAPQT